MTAEPLGFSLVAVGYLSYHKEFILQDQLAVSSLGEGPLMSFLMHSVSHAL